jgi:nucleotide-binding universal stress UspA family protein
MYKEILVPLDGSKRAETILPHVEEIARKFEAQIILLHVMEPYFLFNNPEGRNLNETDEVLHENNIKEAKSYLAGLADEIREKGIKVKWFIEEGPVTQTILNAADRDGVDLITMASHGRTGLSRVFYGSVAASLLNLVDRPLLLIRSESSG